jgi:hypothetical protein
MLKIQNKKFQQHNHFNSFNVQVFFESTNVPPNPLSICNYHRKTIPNKFRSCQINSQKICLEISRKFHEKYA